MSPSPTQSFSETSIILFLEPLHHTTYDTLLHTVTLLYGIYSYDMIEQGNPLRKNIYKNGLADGNKFDFVKQISLSYSG